MAELFNTEEAEIAGVIAEMLTGNVTEVTREARFDEDLRADSLDMVELTMELEERFDISITDAQASDVKTVQDCFNLVVPMIKAARGE